MLHLHLHSDYSTLDGLGRVKSIVARAKEIGAPGVAITDHASISSMPSFFKEAKEQGIRPIIGCEFYWVDNAEWEDKAEKRRHLTVLAKNWNGVQSIMRQLTLANKHFYKRPRLSLDDIFKFEDCVVMTACAFGVLSHPDYERITTKLNDTYGDDFYLEIMPLDFELQDDINKRAWQMRMKLQAPLVMTNDCHYVRQEDSEAHEVLMAVQYGKLWTDPDRKGFGPELYMRTVPEMVDAFCNRHPYLPHSALREAMRSCYEIYEKCLVELPEMPVELPSPDETTSDAESFRKAIREGVSAKLGHVMSDPAKAKVYTDRIVREIAVVQDAGFVPYFLIVSDIIRWARERGIMVGPGRGSAAGSLLCYLMDITQLDPIEHGLLFERFLNPDRVSLPDIDVDFQDDRRSEVFAYIRSKYGEEYTSHINTFSILKPKSAFRDVARVFGVSPFEINTISKLIEEDETDEEGNVLECWDEVPELVAFSKKNPQVVKYTKALNGVIRQVGVHACGMIVSKRKIEEVAVVEHRKGGVEVCNWDMRHCESFGLLKMDILGLSTLTILEHTRRMVKENRGIDIDFINIPLDDANTLQAFARGECIGVFQFESPGIQGLLKAVEAADFDTITAATALYRPGSLDSGETERYIRIARGEDYETYVCPELKPILKETRGVLVYQEQLMRVATELAGFTLPQADTLRKIMGKKLGKEEMEKHRKPFVEGCVKNSIDEGDANTIFDKMIEFARYGFNKSHATAYTLISYWAQYCKQHYTLEFMAATLQPADADRQRKLVNEAKRLGLNLRTPDVNLSGRYFQTDPEENAIIAPLGAIKGVGETGVEEILAVRKPGPFLTVADFLRRVNKRKINKNVQERLSRAGAFESLGMRESDEATRQKDFSELLPIFTDIPNLTIDGLPLDKTQMYEFAAAIEACSNEHGDGRDTMMPVVGSYRPSVMVINAHQSNEKAPITADGPKYMRNLLKEMGIKNIYWTAPIKCQHGKSAPSKYCEATCGERLDKEIRMVRPKLIICCVGALIPKLVGEKKSMSHMNGQVLFSKEYDTYVLFTYSPQYAFYKEEMLPQFRESMRLAGVIFGMAGSEMEEAA